MQPCFDHIFVPISRAAEALGFRLVRDEDYVAEFAGRGGWRIVIRSEVRDAPGFNLYVEKRFLFSRLSYLVDLLMEILPPGQPVGAEDLSGKALATFLQSFPRHIFVWGWPGYHARHEALNRDVA